ncbi:hypothetical protein [Bacillus sp. AK031]
MRIGFDSVEIRLLRLIRTQVARVSREESEWVGHSDRKQPNERVESEFFVDSDTNGPSKPAGVRIGGSFGQKAVQMSSLSPNSVLIRTQLARVSRLESE